MKKILLGCATVLLSLGLLAGCDEGAPIEETVLISVDSEATVVVGDTLTLSYTVSPEKAEVVAASDNEGVVTADAQDGILYLQGASEGSAIVTLVGTYKKYAEANTNISVKVVSEAEAEQEPGPSTGGDGDGDTGGDGGDGGDTGTTEPGPVEEGLLGSFNFSTNEKDGTAISSSSDLDDFWFGEDIYRGISEYDTVYLGNGTSGAFADETNLIKFGTSSLNGTLQLKFAVGTCIDKVVVAAHSWNKITDEYPTQDPNQLVVNGESQDCSVSGTATELTYTITGDLQRFITFETVGRVTIHSIDVYGTYEPDKLETVEITLSATETTLMAGATEQINVTYDESAVFDVEDLTWVSDNEEVATVDENGLVTAVAAGEATITASCELTSSSASIAFTVTEATAKILYYSHTFAKGELGSSTSEGTSDSLSGLKWTYSSSTYKGSDNSKGIQIGSGSAPQKTDPFTFSADFGEEVKLTSITLELGTAKDGGGQYSITLDSNAVATNEAFTTADVTSYTHSDLSVDGEVLTISLLSTTEKAMYIHGISMTLEVGLESSLTF